MDEPNRRYVIFEIEELASIDFEQVRTTCTDTARKNIAETETFVSYEGAMPQTVIALKTKSIPYTDNEMLVIMSTIEWAGLDPELDEL